MPYHIHPTRAHAFHLPQKKASVNPSPPTKRVVTSNFLFCSWPIKFRSTIEWAVDFRFGIQLYQITSWSQTSDLRFGGNCMEFVTIYAYVYHVTVSCSSAQSCWRLSFFLKGNHLNHLFTFPIDSAILWCHKTKYIIRQVVHLNTQLSDLNVFEA